MNVHGELVCTMGEKLGTIVSICPSVCLSDEVHL